MFQRSQASVFRARPRHGWLAVVVAGFLTAPAPGSQAAVSGPSPSILKQAGNLLEWGRWKEARSLVNVELAYPAAGGDAPLMAYYAHILTGFGDREGALQWARKAVAADPRCMSCHLFLAEALGERAKTLARVRAVLEVPKIKRELELAERLDPNNGDVQWGWMRFELELPAVAGGSLEEAARRADRLAQIDPVDGQIARATIALAENQPARALSDYEAGAQRFPDDARAQFYAGMTLYEQGKYSEAAPYLEQAAKLQPQATLYTGFEAGELVREHKLDATRKLLEAASAVHPDSRLGDYMTAQALHDTQQDASWARELLQSYLEVPPEPDQPTAQQARDLLAELNADM